MTHEILHFNEDGIVHARLSGAMTHADQQALEDLARKLIDAGGKVRLLVTLEEFDKDLSWSASRFACSLS